MEMAAYVAREKWSDHPACVSPVIAAFCRSWNDALNDDTRQRLKPYAFKVVGTRTTTKDETTRAWLAADWLARVQAPAWLRLAGLTSHAQALESLARISDATTARAAQPSLDAARAAARGAAGDAAWAAARGASRDAAWAAAGDAARGAARDAAWAAAGDAARTAAWTAAGDAARTAARGAAGDAARAAARDAARDAAGDAAWTAARDATRAAATKSLAPTVEMLQESAFGLLDAMIAVGQK